MADSTNYGLLTNIAGGIREAMTTYQTLKNQQQQQGLLERQLKDHETDRQMKMAQSGLIKGADGSVQFSPEAKQERERQSLEREAALRKSGFQIVKDPTTGAQSIEAIPGYKDLDQELKRAQIGALKAKAGKIDEALTPGEKAADVAYGKDFADYEAGGGKATVDKNLALLQSAIDDMSKLPAQDRSGGKSGLLGDTSMEIFNPQAAIVRDKIRSAIQGTLKQVLGGQFTEKEGQAIFNRAYNPRLSNEENIRRATAELESLKAMASAKEQSGQYFSQKGTLKGKPKTGGGLLPSAQASTSGKIRVSNGKEILEIDPGDESAAAKDGYKRVK